MRRRLWSLAILTVALAAPPARAQEAELIAQLEAERALFARQREDLQRQLDVIRKRLAGEADLADLRQALDDAEAAMAGASGRNPELARIQKGEQDAAAEFRRASEAATRRGGALVGQLKAALDAANKVKADADRRRREADKALWAVRRKVGQSPQVRALQAQAAGVDKAARDARDKDPALVAARKASDAARKACDDARHALPEYKARKDAWAALRGKKRGSPGYNAARKAIQQAEQAYRKACGNMPQRKAQDDARKGYDLARRNHPSAKKAQADKREIQKAVAGKIEELLAADPEGAAALQQRKAAEQGRDQARRQAQELHRRIQEASRSSAHKDPNVLAARKAYDRTRRARHEARKKLGDGPRQARDRARGELDARLTRKLAGDAQAIAIHDRMRLLETRMKEMDARIQDLRKRRAEAAKTH